MKHIAEQFELPFNKVPKKVVGGIGANLRLGKMPRIVTGREISALCRPRGDGACDAFERDLAFDEMSLSEAHWSGE